MERQVRQCMTCEGAGQASFATGLDICPTCMGRGSRVPPTAAAAQTSRVRTRDEQIEDIAQCLADPHSPSEIDRRLAAAHYEEAKARTLAEVHASAELILQVGFNSAGVWLDCDAGTFEVARLRGDKVRAFLAHPPASSVAASVETGGPAPVTLSADDAHTPGPWVAVCRGSCGDTLEGDVYQKALWDIEPVPTGFMRGEFRWPDAQLIAAAPDLLAFARMAAGIPPFEVEAGAMRLLHLREAAKRVIERAVPGNPQQGTGNRDG